MFQWRDHFMQNDGYEVDKQIYDQFHKPNDRHTAYNIRVIRYGRDKIIDGKK